MEKVIKFLAVLTAITLALAFTACDSSDANTDSGNNNGGYTAPTLPPSVGTNPFKGKTFKSLYIDYESFRYVFSDDGKTVTQYYEVKPNGQYKYTVNADAKTLSWYTEKLDYGNGKLFSFEDMVRYFENEYRASLKEKNVDITDEEIDEIIEEYINIQRKIFSEVTTFSYTYDSAEGTLDLVEQFDVDCADFRLYDSHPSIQDASFDMYSGRGLISLYEKNGSQKSFFSEDLSGSFKSEKKIVFTDIEDLQKEEERDTIIATYKLSGSGSDTKLILSFMRGGEQYELTLDFDPEKYHLTEVK